jgi:beta-lactam-binding protein with PASTA domain
VPVIAAGTPVEAAEQAVRDAGLRPVRGSDDRGEDNDSGDNDSGDNDAGDNDSRDDDSRDNDRDENSSAPAGTVLRTDPAAGTELRIGAPVTLVLSNGESDSDSDTVEVPSVIGEDFDEARETLDDAGLDAEGRAAVPFLGRDDGRVVEQDPRAGERVERGTTVTLTTV